MTRLTTYHRPENIDEALALMNRAGTRTVPLAGGTSLLAPPPDDLEEVVDLQDVGLAGIHHEGDEMTLGAMVTLQAIMDDPDAPDLLHRLAGYAGPNTHRHAATVGGLIAGADPESELLAGFLAMAAVVAIATPGGNRALPLADLLADPAGLLRGNLITAATLTKPTASGHARVARTPRDQPIVAAVAVRAPDGQEHLALCGVARTVVLAAPGALDTLDPPGDFRGSPAYRREMAAVMARRATAQLGGEAS